MVEEIEKQAGNQEDNNIHSKQHIFPNEDTMLVTGGSGYLGSWIVFQFLAKGYTVHTTVRSLSDDEKVMHLKKMSKEYPNKLKIFEADLLKENSFNEAVKGTSVVVHVAAVFINEHILLLWGVVVVMLFSKGG